MATLTFKIPKEDIPPRPKYICRCKDPECEECLQEKCQNLNCKTHTRAKKIEARKKLLAKVEKQISNIMATSDNGWRDSLQFRSKMSPLKAEIDELEGKEPEGVLCIDYKRWADPDIDPTVRRIGKFIDGCMYFLLIIGVILVPILALFGLYYILTLIF